MDSATVMNLEFPLDLLIQASQSAELPEDLRRLAAMTVCKAFRWEKRLQLHSLLHCCHWVEETAGQEHRFPGDCDITPKPMSAGEQSPSGSGRLRHKPIGAAIPAAFEINDLRKSDFGTRRAPLGEDSIRRTDARTK